MDATIRQVGLLHTLYIWLYTVCITIKISLIYIAYSFYYSGDMLRQKGNVLLHWWSKKLLSSVQFQFKIAQTNYLQFNPQRRYIIMSNHCSSYDIPVMLLVAKHTTLRMITKKELFRIPLWGRALRLSEFIPIDRGNHRLALQQLQYAKNKMLSGITLWISPEGTRSKDGQLSTFKTGGFKLAKQTDAIIIPIFIENTSQILSKNKRYRLGVNGCIQICPPIDTREHENIRSLCKKTREEINRAQNSRR